MIRSLPFSPPTFLERRLIFLKLVCVRKKNNLESHTLHIGDKKLTVPLTGAFCKGKLQTLT